MKNWASGKGIEGGTGGKGEGTAEALKVVETREQTKSIIHKPIGNQASLVLLSTEQIVYIGLLLTSMPLSMCKNMMTLILS